MRPLPTIVADLGSNDGATAYRARRELDDMSHRVRGAEREKLAVELTNELMAMVTPEPPKENEKAKKRRRQPARPYPKYSAKARKALIQVLALVGGGREVASLAKLLGDFDLRETARWAIERIPGNEATEALVAALKSSVGPEFRVGLVNALAKRQGSHVVAALKECLNDNDREVRLAAADALAHFADPSCDAALAEAVSKTERHGSGRHRTRLVRARIRLAGTLVRAGQKSAAKAVYESVLAGKPDKAQEKAARLGIEQLAAKSTAAR